MGAKVAPNRGQYSAKFVHSGARGSQSVAAEVALAVRAMGRAATGGLTPQNGASPKVI